MLESLANWFGRSDFMPHGHCFLWKPELLWLYVMSDLAIAAAYYSIPIALWYLSRRRPELPLRWILVLFGIFIIACGTTHVLSVVAIWTPIYWLDAGARALTASVSVLTAMVLWPLIPQALRIPSPAHLARINTELESENAMRRRAEQDLRQAGADLERRIEERTAQLHANVERLRASEEQLRRVFEAVPVGILLIDDNGRIGFCNTSASAIFGYPSAELLTQPVEKLVPPRHHSAHTGYLAQYLAHPERRAMGAGREVRGVRRGGAEFPAEIALCPVETDKGRMVLASVIDISERKQSEERLASIVNFSKDAIIGKTLDGIVTSWNPGAERLFGYSAAELIGQSILKIVPPERRVEEVEILRRIRHDESVEHYETVRIRKDGSLVDISVTVSPIKDGTGRVIGASKVAHDITERKKADLALREKSSALERSNNDLEQFAYVASHDLQEPLRMVGSFVQLLQKRYAAQLDERADKYIQYAVDGTSRMQALIQGLLAYSSTGRQNVTMTRVSARKIFDEVCQNLNVAITESGALVTASALPDIVGDETLLVQVFQNLIGNALKYRGIDPPRVHVDAHRDGEMWRFGITDNGIGIAPEYFERIFVIFQRLHARNEYSGTGIGLASCKRFIERLGGRIWVESVPGKGSTFYFTLSAADHTS